jgi:hypothetical protein
MYVFLTYIDVSSHSIFGDDLMLCGQFKYKYSHKAVYTSISILDEDAQEDYDMKQTDPVTGHVRLVRMICPASGKRIDAIRSGDGGANYRFQHQVCLYHLNGFAVAKQMLDFVELFRARVAFEQEVLRMDKRAASLEDRMKDEHVGCVHRCYV